MGAVVGYQFHSLISPCLAGGEILGFQSGEERGQAGNGSVMVDIFDLRLESRRIGRNIVLEIGRKIDDSARHMLSFRLSRGSRSEERRVGKKCVSRCRSRGARNHKKKQK